MLAPWIADAVIEKRAAELRIGRLRAPHACSNYANRTSRGAIPESDNEMTRPILGVTETAKLQLPDVTVGERYEHDRHP